MKIIVLGCGKVGSSLAVSLVREGHDVTVVDNNPQRVRRITDFQDVMSVVGNAASMKTLEEAGAENADLVIATTTNDETNMLSCLVARKLGAGSTIARIRNPEYTEQIDLVSDDLGMTMNINPELVTAGEIARNLAFPAASKCEKFEGGNVELVEFRLSDECEINNHTLIEISKKFGSHALVAVVERDGQSMIPSGSFVVHSGDKLTVIAEHDVQIAFANFANGGGKGKNKGIKKVMIVGGGRVGYYLAKQLRNMSVKVIEQDTERCRTLAQLLPKTIISNGDGTDQDLLQEEGIAEVDAFVSLTGFDEENILVSLYAKKVTGAKVITKISRDNYLSLANDLGLEVVIVPKKPVTEAVLMHVRSMSTGSQNNNIKAFHQIASGEIEAIEFEVSEDIPEFVDIPLKALKLRKNLLVGTIMRNKKALIPDGNTVIRKGDHVIIVSKDAQLSKITDILA